MDESCLVATARRVVKEKALPRHPPPQAGCRQQGADLQISHLQVIALQTAFSGPIHAADLTIRSTCSSAEDALLPEMKNRMGEFLRHVRVE